MASDECRVSNYEWRVKRQSKRQRKLPGPAGDACPTCPKTNEGPPAPPVPQERSAKPEESAPVVKAPVGNRKLTWPQAEAIRLLLRCGQSQRRVARLFNVSRGTITEIVRGTTWKDSGELRVSSDEFGQCRVSSDELRAEKQSNSRGKEKLLVASDELKAKTKQKAENSSKEKAPGPAEEEDGGVWLVSETVQVPGVLLDIPCGMFRSQEQAQAYLREQGERFQLRRIEGDWNRGSDELQVQDSDELRVTNYELKSKGKEKLRVASCELNRKEKA